MLSVYLFTLVFWTLCWLTYSPNTECTTVAEEPTCDSFEVSEVPNLLADVSVAKSETSLMQQDTQTKPLSQTKALSKKELVTILKDRGKWLPQYQKFTRFQLEDVYFHHFG